MNDRKFSVYLSHSWNAQDVDFNEWVWTRLAGACNLLIDKPESQDADPPYYINRLEELMRRTDVFVSVLTYRQIDQAENAFGDALLECSAGSLFEIRLAERANIPRLVIYDRKTGFRPSEQQTWGVKYIAFDRDSDEALPSNEDRLGKDLQDWLNWVQDCRRPKDQERSDYSLILLPERLTRAEVLKPVEAALEKAKFFKRDTISLRHSSDIEILRQFREARLLIADVASETTRDLYAFAHATFLPTIRIVEKGAELPWILTGHPGGYQHDFISESDPAELALKIQERAAAIFRITKPLGLADGIAHIYSRRYRRQLVFLSHCLKPGQRAIVDDVAELLKQRHVPVFEYYSGNESGEDWKKKMTDNLKAATLFVALLTNDYEQSEACVLEWENIQSAKSARILPFLLNGRTAAHVKLKPSHHQTISPGDSQGGRRIADRIVSVLDGKVQLD